MTHADHLSALGRLVTNGQVVEITLGHVLARVIGVHEDVGRVIAGRSSTSAVANMIADLTDDDEVRGWAREAQAAMVERNRFVHGILMSGTEDGDVDRLMHRGKVVPVSEPTEDLSTVVDRLAACVRRGMALTIQ